MKVICINAGPLPGDVPDQPKLKEGEPYTVVRETIGVDFKGYRKMDYVLEEIPPPSNPIWKSYAYQKERFVPLSEKDEREYIEEVLEAMFEPVIINRK